MISIGACTKPRPQIHLSLTPLHCWGFDPIALTKFNRDPKNSQADYEISIRPRDIKSQMLPDEIIDIALEYA